VRPLGGGGTGGRGQGTMRHGQGSSTGGSGAPSPVLYLCVWALHASQLSTGRVDSLLLVRRPTPRVPLFPPSMCGWGLST
jgi:hypothetical protein